MGIRAVTLIVDRSFNKSNEQPIVNMYRQHDGYPEGHGKELFDFLDGKILINGIGGDAAYGTHANGAGCLAAQMVNHFKEDLGGIYLHGCAKTVEPLVNDGDDYGYVVYIDTEQADPTARVSVEVYSWGEKQFAGTVAEFGAWIASERDEG